MSPSGGQGAILPRTILGNAASACTRTTFKRTTFKPKLNPFSNLIIIFSAILKGIAMTAHLQHAAFHRIILDAAVKASTVIGLYYL